MTPGRLLSPGIPARTKTRGVLPPGDVHFSADGEACNNRPERPAYSSRFIFPCWGRRRFRTSSLLSPRIRITLFRAVCPLRISTLSRFRPSCRLRKTTNSRLARPFCGGAAIFSRSVSWLMPVTSLLAAPGRTRIASLASSSFSFSLPPGCYIIQHTST